MRRAAKNRYSTPPPHTTTKEEYDADLTTTGMKMELHALDSVSRTRSEDERYLADAIHTMWVTRPAGAGCAAD